MISDNTAVNIRESPSVTAGIISSAKPKIQYELVDQANQNWYKIKFSNDKVGWVMRKFFRIIKNEDTDNAPVLISYVTTDIYNINIRQKPDSSSGVIGTILKKGKYEIVDNKNQYWIQVKFNGGKTGWVVRKLVRIVNN